MRRGAINAGGGAIAFGVLTILGTFGGSPGGSYDESTVVEYVKSSHFPIVVITGYLAIVGVVGLIFLLAYLRELISAGPDGRLARISKYPYCWEKPFPFGSTDASSPERHVPSDDFDASILRIPFLTVNGNLSVGSAN